MFTERGDAKFKNRAGLFHCQKAKDATCTSWVEPRMLNVLKAGRPEQQRTVCVCVLSHVRLSVTPWTVAHQTPLSVGFPRQEYWSGLPFPSPGDILDAGIRPCVSCTTGGFFTTEPPGKPYRVSTTKRRRTEGSRKSLLDTTVLIVTGKTLPWMLNWLAKRWGKMRNLHSCKAFSPNIY